MAKGKESASDQDKDYQISLDNMQRDHVRQGRTPIGPTKLPSGKMYTPPTDEAQQTPGYTTADTDTNTPAPTPTGYKKGGKVKPRGVGIALRGHTRAKTK